MNKKQYEKPVMRIVEQRLTTYLQNASVLNAAKQRYSDGNEEVNEGNGGNSLNSQLWEWN